jgi:sigma-54-specific transcriptional regulator
VLEIHPRLLESPQPPGRGASHKELRHPSFARPAPAPSIAGGSTNDERPIVQPLLSLPSGQTHPLSIRARALVFEDPRSRAILDTLARIAPSAAPALIVGAAGTGKELVARHVHQHSGRAGPFIALNCGAFDEATGEAELFGTAVGARPRGGWIEAAHGGTLFLDEIGDLAPALQLRLLRVLQERQVVRVGADRAVDVDVRLVAATHIELSRAVEAGHFRRDLWYRLSVATLALPALAERPGDIVPLARHFIQTWCAKLALPQATLAADGIAALQAHTWPGNIRELENVIHYALLVGSDGVLRASDLKLAGARGTGIDAPAPAQSESPARSPTADLDIALRALMRSGLPELQAHVEQRLIHNAYALCDHNQVRTARLLGISRNVLRAQLIRFGYLTQTGERRAVRPQAVQAETAD